MAAYIIVDVKVTDPEAYERYQATVAPTLAKYGGRFLVRGGPSEILEGEWRPNRLVVVEFASMEQAKAWWNSDDYAEPKKLRQSASHTNLVVARKLTIESVVAIRGFDRRDLN